MRISLKILLLFSFLHLIFLYKTVYILFCADLIFVCDQIRADLLRQTVIPPVQIKQCRTEKVVIRAPYAVEVISVRKHKITPDAIVCAGGNIMLWK